MERTDLRFISPLVKFALTGPPIRPVKKTEAKQEEQTINHTKGENAMTVFHYGFDNFMNSRIKIPVYHCLRTYEKCALLLRNFRTISNIGLDYDPGQGETGLSVLKYMAECGNEVKHINICPTQPTSAPKMREYAQKYFPNTELILNHR